MNLSKIGKKDLFSLMAAICIFCTAAIHQAAGQSTLQDYPTPVTTNEIKGVINARNIGDSRLTTHYYVFDGSQGDIFVNVNTTNFAGDIDIFIEQGLRPLSKIVLYADNPATETGRIIYLRKQERLLLRVQGRTPNDDAAYYQIKFAGSFVALNKDEVSETPELPVVTSSVIAREIPQKDRSDEAEETQIVRRNQQPEQTEVNRTATVKPPASTAPPSRTDQTTRRDRTRAQDSNAGFSLVVEFRDGGTINRSMTDVQRFTVDGGILTVIYKSGAIGRYPMTTVVRIGIEQSN